MLSVNTCKYLFRYCYCISEIQNKKKLLLASTLAGISIVAGLPSAVFVYEASILCRCPPTDASVLVRNSCCCYFPTTDAWCPCLLLLASLLYLIPTNSGDPAALDIHDVLFVASAVVGLPAACFCYLCKNF